MPATQFINNRFPTDISFGAVGGPTFETGVIQFVNGKEQRNAKRDDGLRVWDVAHALKTQDELDALLEFFIEARGRAHGFRFKDWTDYSITDEDIGDGDGSTTTFQATKTYGSLNPQVRDLKKLVSGTTTVSMEFLSTQDITALHDDDRDSINVDTGIITFGADISATILTISAHAGAPLVTTDAPHGLSVNESVYVSGTSGGGASGVNGFRFKVSATPTADTFNLWLADTSAGACTGGAINTLPQTGEAVYLTTEYDVPCRFDVDEMKVTLADYNAYSWGQILVRELHPDE